MILRQLFGIFGYDVHLIFGSEPTRSSLTISTSYSEELKAELSAYVLTVDAEGKHPEWYPGLTAESSVMDFQLLIHDRMPGQTGAR